MSDNITKTASDDAAKKYWESFYGDYGKLLTRDIPRRIKAALADKKKVASIDDAAEVKPVAYASSGDSVIVEGLYTSDSQKILFRASLSQAGDVEDIQTISLK